MTSEGLIQQRVVVGVDGSAESVAALGWAARYAQQAGATVRAVLAWHYPGAVGGPPVEVSPLRHETEQQMQDRLNEAVAQVYPGPGPDNNVEAKVSYGHPAEVLIDESKDADLLVVGHRGHGGFPGMHIGSVAIHCVNAAQCPVTVVRTKT
jgi:nucleotide-binding universal stress UspA family protein